MRYEILIKTLKEKGNCYISGESFSKLDLEKVSKDINAEIEVKEVIDEVKGKVLWVVEK